MKKILIAVTLALASLACIAQAEEPTLAGWYNLRGVEETAPLSQLLLQPNGNFLLTMTNGGKEQRMNGVWKHQENKVVLVPDTSGFESMELRIEDSNLIPPWWPGRYVRVRDE